MELIVRGSISFCAKYLDYCILNSLVDSKVCKTKHLAIVFLYFVCLFVNSVLV